MLILRLVNGQSPLFNEKILVLYSVATRFGRNDSTRAKARPVAGHAMSRWATGTEGATIKIAS